MTLPRGEDPEADALLTDRYLEALLVGDDRVLGRPSDAALDARVRHATARLRRDLVRVHPSFRFEERLAGRGAGAARSMRLVAAAGAELVPATVVPLEPARQAGIDPDPLDFDGAGAEPIDSVVVIAGGLPRPLLIGGALTSAALSLAGVALVAWRRNRPASGSPMARAARAVRAQGLRGAASGVGIRAVRTRLD